MAELPGRLGLATVRDLDLEQRLPDRRRHRWYRALLLDWRLRVRAVPVPRQAAAIQPDAGDLAAAGLRAADPQLPAVLEARLVEHVPAADGAALLRQRLLHLPVPAVLPDDPARSRR